MLGRREEAIHWRCLTHVATVSEPVSGSPAEWQSALRGVVAWHVRS